MSEKPEKLTITLTNRQPVKITKDDWPIVARSESYWYDSQYDFQANRKKKWSIIVRQHNTDGRTIVYGVYSYSTAFRGESGATVRGGKIITVEGVTEDCVGETAPIIDAIQEVGNWMMDNIPSHRAEDAEVFRALINECIADLPAEEL